MLQCRPAQEFSFGPRALKDALVSMDPALQRLYTSAFSPAERLFLAEAYSPQRSLFCTLLIHTAFDWLLSRPEAPEDFETFHAAQLARRPALGRKHIYLQPIGMGWGHAPRRPEGWETPGAGWGVSWSQQDSAVGQGPESSTRRCLYPGPGPRAELNCGGQGGVLAPGAPGPPPTQVHSDAVQKALAPEPPSAAGAGRLGGAGRAGGAPGFGEDGVGGAGAGGA